MAEFIEFDPVDDLGAGAVGEPGQRQFLIQARKGTAVLSVLVEKEQVAALALEATRFLEGLDEPAGEAEAADEELPPAGEGTVAPGEPLFRARLIGIGYDEARGLVLIELREHAESDPDEGEVPPPVDESEGHVARLFATRAQVRAMALRGAEAVAAGRPRCDLCDQPMDPAGHVCPRWN